jgi:hypothetical protein
MKPFLIVALVVLISAIPRTQIGWLWYLSVGTYLTLIAFQVLNIYRPKHIKLINRLSLGLVGLLLLMFVLVEGKPVRTVISQEPKAQTYTTDAMLFLKTYHLMRHGESYYPAFAAAYDGDHRVTGNPPDVWGFRLPTTFYVWQILTLNQPVLVYWLFVGYCLLVLYGAYRVSLALAGPRFALLSPALLLPYLLYGLTTYEFLQAEWWGIGPILVMLYGIITKQSHLIFVGALLAPLMRETYVLPVIGVGIWYFIQKQWSLAKPFFLAALAYIVLYSLHAYQVFQIIPYSPKMITTGRMHVLTLEFIHQVLVYGTWKYWLAPYRLFTLYFFAMVALATYMWFTLKKHRLLIMQLVLLSATSLSAFLKIGLCCWGDYWGVMTAPFIVISLALLINLKGSKINL